MSRVHWSPLTTSYEKGARTVPDVDLVGRGPHDNIAAVVHNHTLARPSKQHKEFAHSRHSILHTKHASWDCVNLLFGMLSQPVTHRSCNL